MAWRKEVFFLFVIILILFQNLKHFFSICLAWCRLPFAPLPLILNPGWWWRCEIEKNKLFLFPRLVCYLEKARKGAGLLPLPTNLLIFLPFRVVRSYRLGIQGRCDVNRNVGDVNSICLIYLLYEFTMLIWEWNVGCLIHKWHHLAALTLSSLLEHRWFIAKPEDDDTVKPSPECWYSRLMYRPFICFVAVAQGML